MTDRPCRPLLPRERALLDLLLAEDFPGAPELRLQAASARGRRPDDDPTLVGLQVVDPNVPRAEVITRVPVEAEVIDVTPPQQLLVHVVDGLPDCLELVTYGTVLDELPNAAAFDQPRAQPARRSNRFR